MLGVPTPGGKRFCEPMMNPGPCPGPTSKGRNIGVRSLSAFGACGGGGTRPAVGLDEEVEAGTLVVVFPCFFLLLSVASLFCSRENLLSESSMSRT
jgi:hypothetical protein